MPTYPGTNKTQNTGNTDNISSNTLNETFSELNTGALLILIIVIAVIVLQLAVFFAQLKLYSINTTLANQFKLMEDMDMHIYELKLTGQEQIRILNEINESLKEIKQKTNF